MKVIGYIIKFISYSLKYSLGISYSIVVSKVFDESKDLENTQFSFNKRVELNLNFKARVYTKQFVNLSPFLSKLNSKLMIL